MIVIAIEILSIGAAEMMRRRSGGSGGSWVILLFFLFLAAGAVPVAIVKSQYSFRTENREGLYAAIIIFVTYALAAGTAGLVAVWDSDLAWGWIYMAAVISAVFWGTLVAKVVLPLLAVRRPDITGLSEADGVPPDNGHSSTASNAHGPKAESRLGRNESPFTPPTASTESSAIASASETWDAPTEVKKGKRVVVWIGLATIALAIVIAAVVYVYEPVAGLLGVETEDGATTDHVAPEPIPEGEHAACETWVQHQLINHPGAADSAENANAVIQYAQSQNPDRCPREKWNPLITDVAKRDDGSISVSFSTTIGNARGAAVTLPESNASGWLYDADTQTWGTPPSTLVREISPADARECDNILQEDLLASTKADAAAGNAAVRKVRSDGPAICTGSQWLPKVLVMDRDHIGNIELRFSPGGAGVTRPADGSLRWTYTSDDGLWQAADFSVPSVLVDRPSPVGQPADSAAVQTARAPTRTPQPTYTRQPPPTKPTTLFPTLPTPFPTLPTLHMLPTPPPGNGMVVLGDEEWFYGSAWSEFERGGLLLDIGDYQGAIAAYESAQAYHGKPSRVLENRIGISFQVMGNHQNAIVHFTKALEIKDNPADRVNRALSYLETGKCSLAIHDAEKTLYMDAEHTDGLHTDAEAHVILASCHDLSDDYERATKHGKLALPLMRSYGYSDDDIAWVLELIGDSYRRDDQYALAIDYYSQSIAALDTASARENRAWAYYFTSDCANAVADSQAALRLPAVHWNGYHSRANAHRILALCHLNNSEWELALDHADDALQLMRENGYDPDLIADWASIAQDLRSS